MTNIKSVCVQCNETFKMENRLKTFPGRSLDPVKIVSEAAGYGK